MTYKEIFIIILETYIGDLNDNNVSNVLEKVFGYYVGDHDSIPGLYLNVKSYPNIWK